MKPKNNLQKRRGKMSKKRERKERKKSTARRRAEGHATGFSTTTLKLPEGLNFFEPKKGIRTIDIIPYTVGEGNPWAEKGELHYERTFWKYNKIGIEEKNYICASKTFGHKDFIQEWRQKESKNTDTDAQVLKDLAPKERQLFLVYDNDDKEKGLQLWEYSYHNFGKALDQMTKTSSEKSGWDLFYFPDDDGMTLRLDIGEAKANFGSFDKVLSIVFMPREETLPNEIVNHGFCLDDMLVETPYEELKSIFLMGDSSEPEGSEPESDEAEESEEEEKKDVAPKSDPTAKDFGLSNQDDVMYKGEKHTIFKISKDGTSLTLIDENDDIVKAVSPAKVTKIEDEEGEESQDNEPEEKSDSDGEWDEGEEWE